MVIILDVKVMHGVFVSTLWSNLHLTVSKFIFSATPSG